MAPECARGAAIADLDTDGFLDIALNCKDQPAVLLRNEGYDANWLIVDLKGTRSNAEGIGCRARVIVQSAREQHAVVSAVGSYLSSNDRCLHFGLGNSERAELVEIEWPGGAVQRFENVRANQILAVIEPDE